VMRAHRMIAIALAFVFVAGGANASSLDAKAVNEAQWSPSRATEKNAVSALMIKAQVLLDRAHFSPGEIDGKAGGNFKKALTAFAADKGLNTSRGLSAEVWQALLSISSEPILAEYTVSEKDVAGPFAASIPAKMEQMRNLPTLAYTSGREALAERFHVSQELLQLLNPGNKFDKPGDKILVASVAADDVSEKATRIEVDKRSALLKVLGEQNKLLAVYPATIGSNEKPAPSGRLKVSGVTKNPTYRYNPKYAFKGVHTNEPFMINPGPNNPVGLVWIGLSAEGYGIHGTADPSKISKTASHGCVRLTNWDALHVAAVVKKGLAVDFLDGQRPDVQAQLDARGHRRHR